MQALPNLAKSPAHKGALKETGRQPLRIAVGLAIPCIEAWYRCGIDATVTEANWLVALRERQFPYDNSRLKALVYGSDRVSLATENAPYGRRSHPIVRQSQRA